MGRGGSNHPHHNHRHSSSSTTSSSSSSSSTSQLIMRKHLSTDLRLGRAAAEDHEGIRSNSNRNNTAATCFVKVYMEGIPIGRKLDLLAYSCYQDMIRTVDDMFATNILWDEIMEGTENNYYREQQQINYHVLTYEDKEGDWLIVGDVPWEMFVSCVKRLKITRADSL